MNYQEEKCLKGYGEYIIVNKFGYLFNKAERGDIVVFHPPDDPSNFYIKRVVGLPGESIKLEDGEVYLKTAENKSWQLIEEEYLNEKNKGKTSSFSEEAREFEIPSEKYFVMGDNRRASTDSRTCFKDPFGGGCKGKDATPFISMENIEGKAWVVLWPFELARVIETSEYSL